MTPLQNLTDPSLNMNEFHNIERNTDQGLMFYPVFYPYHYQHMCATPGRHYCELYSTLLLSLGVFSYKAFYLSWSIGEPVNTSIDIIICGRNIYTTMASPSQWRIWWHVVCFLIVLSLSKYWYNSCNYYVYGLALFPYLFFRLNWLRVFVSECVCVCMS